METAEKTETAIEGRLEETPLPQLIIKIFNRKLSGMLHLEGEGKPCWIFFDDGFPAGVHNPKSQDYLGQVMRELGFVDDAAFNQSLMTMAKNRRLQGEILLEMGAIDEEKLERALSLQVARKLARLFTLRAGAFRFAEYEELPPPTEPIRVNPYALVYNGIRNAYSADDLKKELEPLVGKSCRATGEFIERKELFDFPPEDLAQAELLREFRLPQEFVRATRSGSTSGMMMLLCLSYCGMLELEDPSFAQHLPGGESAAAARPAPAAAASARPAPAAGQKPAGRGAASSSAQQTSSVPADLRAKIEAKFEQVKTAPPWQILEVEKEASSENIKRSFITLAKVYHPDRLSGHQDEQVKHKLDLIFAKINEAYEVMSNPERRIKFEQQAADAQKSGGARPEDARLQFQKAVVFFRKKEMAQAAECMRWATDLDPKNGEYRAWAAWINYLREGDTSPERKVKLRDELVETVKQNPETFVAWKFLAKLHNELGEQEHYFKALQKAAQLNPRDIEVARELRLFQMRKEKGNRGFFGKILK